MSKHAVRCITCHTWADQDPRPQRKIRSLPAGVTCQHCKRRDRPSCGVLRETDACLASDVMGVPRPRPSTAQEAAMAKPSELLVDVEAALKALYAAIRVAANRDPYATTVDDDAGGDSQ